jgi:hypothetical protein
MGFFIWIGALLLSFSLSAQSKDIYRWIDAEGATHYADKVPKEFKGKARKVDAHVNEVGTNRQAAMDETPVISTPPVPTLSRHGDQPESAGSSASAGTSDAGAPDDCAVLRRRYWESQECFNRYRNVNGSVKAEAYQHCAVVNNPVAQCGPVITEP